MRIAIVAILKWLDIRIDMLLRIVLTTVSIFLVCSILAQIFYRFFFFGSFRGLEEIIGYSGVWLYLMGAAYATRNRSHIMADMLDMVFKKQKQLLIAKTLASAIAFVVACFMIVWSYIYINWSITEHEILIGIAIPAIWFQIALLIGAVLIAVYFFVDTVTLSRQTLHLYLSKTPIQVRKSNVSEV